MRNYIKHISSFYRRNHLSASVFMCLSAYCLQKTTADHGKFYRASKREMKNKKQQILHPLKDNRSEANSRFSRAVAESCFPTISMSESLFHQTTWMLWVCKDRDVVITPTVMLCRAWGLSCLCIPKLMSSLQAVPLKLGSYWDDWKLVETSGARCRLRS